VGEALERIFIQDAFCFADSANSKQATTTHEGKNIDGNLWHHGKLNR